MVNSNRRIRIALGSLAAACAIFAVLVRGLLAVPAEATDFLAREAMPRPALSPAFVVAGLPIIATLTAAILFVTASHAGRAQRFRRFADAWCTSREGGSPLFA